MSCWCKNPMFLVPKNPMFLGPFCWIAMSSWRYSISEGGLGAASSTCGAFPVPSTIESMEEGRSSGPRPAKHFRGSSLLSLPFLDDGSLRPAPGRPPSALSFPRDERAKNLLATSAVASLALGPRVAPRPASLALPTIPACRPPMT